MAAEYRLDFLEKRQKQIAARIEQLIMDDDTSSSSSPSDADPLSLRRKSSRVGSMNESMNGKKVAVEKRGGFLLAYRKF